jgi:hypothetical protein
MKVLWLSGLLFAATPAFAQERYQLLPLVGGGAPPNPIRYTALVVDTQSSLVYGCDAAIKDVGTSQKITVVCNTIKISQGTLPVGHAALSPNTYSIVNRYFGFWKVDSSDGNVTFCGSPGGDNPPTSMLCGTARLNGS